jgi:peptidoglycan hydrolase-like protein with peptidoglycan-binding domain
MLALRTARTKLVVAGVLALAGCSASGAAVTRTGAPPSSSGVAAAAAPAAGGESAAAADPAVTAAADPAVTAAAALATTPDPSATTAAPDPSATAAPAPPPTTAAPAPPPTDPPPPPTTAQTGPVLEVAPPLAAPLTPVGPSSGGAEVSALQQRLLDLGFWVPDTDGKYGWVTQQAVMAFQKYSGLTPSGTADQTTIDLLNMAPYRVLGQGWDQDMIEVDKTKQLLYIIRGGRTVWVMNTSTGSGVTNTEPNQRTPGQQVSGVADTPEGTFKVYSQQSNGWWQGDLGQLYRPKFFKGGSAVHGAPKVPNYPASHGCVRITPEAMDFIWSQDLMPMGETVWVHV